MERPATAPAKTTNKSGISTEQRRIYAENAKRKQAETMTPAQLAEKREKDATRAKANREKLKALGVSIRATMSAEKLAELRESQRIHSLNKRNRERGLPEVLTLKQQRLLASAPVRASTVPPLARFEVPSLDIIAAMDRGIKRGVNDSIEKTHPGYRHSVYAFGTKEEEEKDEQLERSAQYSKRPRSHYRMTSSATTEETENKQRIQGGKKAKTQKAAKKK